MNIACAWDLTPLTRAVYSGHLTVVRQLLSRDDVDVTRTYGNQLPALSWAIHLKRKKVVKLLLAKSEIDIHLPHKKGVSVSVCTRFCEYNNQEVAEGSRLAS